MEIVASTGRAEIDTSRPFQSVREAVGVFGGERRVPGGRDGGSSRGRNASSSNFSVPPAAPPALMGSLKMLEAELAEARSELAELKQRQSQMEMAVSSVSVQFANSLGIFSVGPNKGKELAVVDRSAMVGAEEEYGDGRVRSDLWVDDTRAEEHSSHVPGTTGTRDGNEGRESKAGKNREQWGYTSLERLFDSGDVIQSISGR
jgi:hypothetical protein